MSDVDTDARPILEPPQTITAPDEVILTTRQLGVLLDAISNPECIDPEEVNRVVDEIRHRWDRSCLVYPFPRQPGIES